MYLIALLLPTASCFLIDHQSNPVDTSFHRYTTRWRLHRTKNDITLGLVSLHSECDSLFNQFAKNLPPPKILNRINDSLITEFFIFLPDWHHLRRMTQRWHTSKETSFVVCKPVQNTTTLFEILGTMWSQKFLDFVVVYYDQNLRIVTYNPFTEEIVDLEAQPLFPNKLKDLAGYRIKVAMFDNPPVLRLFPGGCRGKDCDYLRLVAFAMNATVQIVATPAAKQYAGVGEALLNSEADFSFMGVMRGPDVADLEVFHTQMETGIVAVLPSHRPHTVNILTIFNNEIWTCLTILLLTLYALTKITKKYRRAFNLFVLLFTTVPSAFSNIFQSGISSILTIAKHDDSVNTIEALKTSNMPLLTFPRVVPIVNKIHNFSQPIQTFPKKELYEMIERRDNDKVFVLPVGVALEFVERSDMYRIMRESLVPDMKVYLFPKRSPFLKQIHQIFVHLGDGGFIRRITTSGRKHLEDDDVYLTMKHLQTVLCFVSGGYAVSVVAILVECVKGRKK
jgi:hypothetical protein